MPHIFYLMPLMIILPLILLTISHKSFLMALLNLELMMLGIIMFSFMSSLMLANTEALTTLLILSMSACEASLGLACLVNMLRSHGNDNIKSLSAIKC